MICLTPNWPAKDQLWQHPLYGARTLANIDKMGKLSLAACRAIHATVSESSELANRRENFIDSHGFSNDLY
jgi:hypothetical protein